MLKNKMDSARIQGQFASDMIQVMNKFTKYLSLMRPEVMNKLKGKLLKNYHLTPVASMNSAFRLMRNEQID